MNEPIQLACTETGSGPPVILVHGLLGNGNNLKPLAGALAESYRVLTPDLRNHGQSPHSDDMNYAALTADIIALLDKHEIDRATLIGHSLGGKTVMATALNHPERVDKLVSLDMAPVPYSQFLGELLDTLLAMPIAEMDSRKAADQWLKDQGVQEDRLRAFLLQNLVRDKQGFCWRINLSVLRNQRRTMTGFPTDADPWTGPALFLHGAESDYIKPEYHDAIYKLFPAAEIEAVPNAGHWLHADRPEAIAERLLRFLKD